MDTQYRSDDEIFTEIGVFDSLQLLRNCQIGKPSHHLTVEKQGWGFGWCSSRVGISGRV